MIAIKIMKHQAAARVKNSSRVFLPRILLRRCNVQINKDSGATNNGELPWQREYYKYFLPIQTRWSDNDQYGHVNNVTYYSYFDSVINHYLMRHAGLNTDLQTSDVVGYMVDTDCVYRSPISFPEVALAGLTISHIGRSSVQYTIAIFPERAHKSDRDQISKPVSANFGNHSLVACAVGHCVHVFVDTETNRPALLPDGMRRALEKIAIAKESTSKL